MNNFISMDKVADFISKLKDFVTMNSSFEVLIKGILLYLAFFWIALVIWVAKDVISRSNSILFHVFTIILNIVLPIFGLMIYLLIRPSRTLLDKYYEDLEYQTLVGNDKHFCGNCTSPIEDDFKFCGKCGDTLTFKCGSCKKESLKEYKICPFCGTSKDENENKEDKTK